MTVVADASPLNYLILIEEIDLLPSVFETILVPEAVVKAGILMDDFKGRKLAKGLNLEVMGTLGILNEAAMLGLVDIHQALHRLTLTKFRLSRSIRQDFKRSFLP